MSFRKQSMFLFASDRKGLRWNRCSDAFFRMNIWILRMGSIMRSCTKKDTEGCSSISIILLFPTGHRQMTGQRNCSLAHPSLVGTGCVHKKKRDFCHPGNQLPGQKSLFTCPARARSLLDYCAQEIFLHICSLLTFVLLFCLLLVFTNQCVIK